MPAALMWFRRDLRLHDNHALSNALRECERVYCAFIFDTEILDKLEDKADRRVDFIHQSIVELAATLRNAGGGLIIRHGRAIEQIPHLAEELAVDRVYAAHDYEPRRILRDDAVRTALRAVGRDLVTCKDHVIFEKNEIRTADGRPFRVYTPYKKAWRAALSDDALTSHLVEPLARRLTPPPARVKSHPWSLIDLGFQKTDLKWPGGARAGRDLFDAFLAKIRDYKKRRDFPADDGVSHLSVHLRFGTVSIRELIREALDEASDGAQTWIDELIWREFYNMILHHFPHTERRAFQTEFDALPWKKDQPLFQAWCEARTGYPIVDAAMRELNMTGYMHNRARMIVASFLTKDLLIDWKWGERYFARKLLDYDLSQNLGGWQWSASIGTDAQPYFRIFNPVLQSERFDPHGRYIRAYLPELSGYPDDAIHAPWKVPPIAQAQFGAVIGRDYPTPVIDHTQARAAALALFKSAKSKPR